MTSNLDFHSAMTRLD